MDLDDETRAELTGSGLWVELCEGLEIKRAKKLARDSARVASERTSTVTKRREAEYQKAYAQSPEGKARRYAAKVAYRRRKRAASAKAAPNPDMEAA